MHTCRVNTNLDWFSHDVTKIQSKVLPIFLRFYLNELLKQLKSYIFTNFFFKRGCSFCDWNF